MMCKSELNVKAVDELPKIVNSFLLIFILSQQSSSAFAYHLEIRENQYTFIFRFF